MPIYDFKCQHCEISEERLIKSSDFEIVCRNCGSLIRIDSKLPSAPHIVSGVGFKSKIPDGFKDKLREIKKTGGMGSKIDV